MAIQAQLFSENLGFALGNYQDLCVETACGFDDLCFGSSQQQHQQLIHFDEFQNQKNFNNRFHELQSVAVSQSISTHIDRQRLEFEQFVNLQNERLRIAMLEQRKQQMSILVKKCEWKTELLFKQKEEEITRAVNRNMELQNFLKRIETENQTWQSVARESDAMIASLNSSIQRLKETAHLSENAVGDSESCCQVGEMEENREMKMVCKCCNSRNSCVLILPCRHLCSCKDCEVFLDSCPVCSMVKKATIEALI